MQIIMQAAVKLQYPWKLDKFVTKYSATVLNWGCWQFAKAAFWINHNLKCQLTKFVYLFGVHYGLVFYSAQYVCKSEWCSSLNSFSFAAWYCNFCELEENWNSKLFSLGGKEECAVPILEYVHILVSICPIPVVMTNSTSKCCVCHIQQVPNILQRFGETYCKKFLIYMYNIITVNIKHSEPFGLKVTVLCCMFSIKPCTVMHWQLCIDSVVPESTLSYSELSILAYCPVGQVFFNIYLLSVWNLSALLHILIPFNDWWYQQIYN